MIKTSSLASRAFCLHSSALLFLSAAACSFQAFTCWEGDWGLFSFLFLGGRWPPDIITSTFPNIQDERKYFYNSFQALNIFCWRSAHQNITHHHYYHHHHHSEVSKLYPNVKNISVGLSQLSVKICYKAKAQFLEPEKLSVHWPVSGLALAGPLTSTHPTAQGGEHSIAIQIRGLSLSALYWSETGDVVLVLMNYVKSI